MEAESEFRPVAPERGTFLISSPRLLDPNFMHTVVLLCEHNDDGSYGLIVNRPGKLTVADLHSDNELLEDREDRLWMGGPVQLETVQLLHRLGPGIPGSLHVVDDLHLGGDPAVIRRALEKRQESRELIRFVLGYSGWGEGQLEAELAEGAWVVCPAAPELVFDPRPETLWRRALKRLGGAWASLAHEPPDPTWN
jgi:putative transcriptional regulator